MTKANRFRFRAWDTSHERMRSGNVFMVDADDGEIMDEFGFARSDRYILMQSTGLLDKNGREIFEGDILEIDKPHPGYKDTEKCEVKFGHHQTSTDYYASSAYGWYADSGGFEGETSLAQLRPHAIIGNIHENPEMLK